MYKSIPLLCFLLLQASGSAATVTIGEARFEIAPPPGYSLITSDMQPYADVAQRFVPPDNEQLALFLSEADAVTAARGEIPEPKRWFYVQTPKKAIERFITSKEFEDLKKTVKMQNAEILKKVEGRMPDLFDKINKGIVKDYDVNLNLSLNETITLPSHHESSRSFSYSMLVKFQMNDESGKPSVFEGVVTATVVHLRGKILFFYTSAEQTALEWSRTELQKWTDTIIAANPSVGDIAAREARPPGFKWNKVGESAVVGAVVGAIVAALVIS